MITPKYVLPVMKVSKTPAAYIPGTIVAAKVGGQLPQKEGFEIGTPIVVNGIGYTIDYIDGENFTAIRNDLLEEKGPVLI